MRVLLILRGVPGCGKSTLARVLTRSALFDINVEADQYFMEDGEYKFDPDKIDSAHGSCKYKVEKAMEEGFHRIILSNTSCKQKELVYYYELAEKHNYQVFSLVVENRHGGTNQHGVPEEKLQAMEQALKSTLKLR